MRNSPEPRCPVTGKKLDLKKDVIHLQSGGTVVGTFERVVIFSLALIYP